MGISLISQTVRDSQE